MDCAISKPRARAFAHPTPGRQSSIAIVANQQHLRGSITATARSYPASDHDLNQTVTMNQAILAEWKKQRVSNVQDFVQFIRSLGAARIAAMVAVTVALIGFFAFIMMRVTAPQMTPLFTDLSFDDSAAIVKDLERQGIPYELKADNAIVLVPKDMVTRLRMKLAEAGLPKGGGIGYEIFDKSDALGATSFVQNINHLRALEGELARTIRAIDRVQAARVHLVLPERA